MQELKFIAGLIVVVFIGLAGLLILWYMVTGKINLEKLISEDDGTASMSRFQLLVFTIVIAMSLFLIIVGQEPPAFPPKIPAEILALLGISGGSYVISKGIQKSGGKDDSDKGKEKKPKDPAAGEQVPV